MLYGVRGGLTHGMTVGPLAFAFSRTCGEPVYLSFPLADLRAGFPLVTTTSPWLVCHAFKDVANGVFVG